MKRNFIKCAVLVFCATILSSLQLTASNDSKATWFGIDFSHAKMIGSHGFNKPTEIKTYYFDRWNGLILKENDKFDIKKYYRYKTVDIFLDIVNRQNESVDALSLVTDNSHELSIDDVKNIVKQYAGVKEGLGLLYVVESFSKIQEKAFVYAVLFDAQTGEIITVKKRMGEASGLGFRNYWVNALWRIMKQGLK
jgi:hypothetical protein